MKKPEIAFHNARKSFMTAKIATTVGELLKQHLPQTTTPEIVFEAGGVWLDRKRAPSLDHPLEKGDTLRVYIAPLQGKTYVLESSMVVLEHADFMIVYKPAGLTTVCDRSNLTYNLTAAVAAYYKKRKINYVPSPIMRLDYLVDGLVIYPKHKDAERTLFQMMKDHKIKKYYVAKLEKSENPPRCKRTSDHLDFIHKTVASPTGKKAESLFILRNQTSDYDEYGVVLFTGRRHQIRFHAATYLQPILHDSLYGKGNVNDPQPLGLTAMALNFTYKGKRFRVRLHRHPQFSLAKK